MSLYRTRNSNGFVIRQSVFNKTFTDACRVATVRTIFVKRVKYKGFPKGLFRFGVVALARIFQISSYNVFQYVIELIKPKLHLAKLSIQTQFNSDQFYDFIHFQNLNI